MRSLGFAGSDRSANSLNQTLVRDSCEQPVLQEGAFAVKASRRGVMLLLAMSLLLLISVGVFGNWYAPAFGDAGMRVQHFLVQPLFSMGGLPVTIFFILKALIFIVALVIFSHFTMLVLQKRVLKHTPLPIGQQYAAAKVISYLVFVLGLTIGLQSLGVNLNSLVVVGGALGIGVGLGLQAIVSNFVAGLILLLEQPIKLGDRIQVGDTYGDVVRLRGRSTWIRTNENVVIIVPNSEFINQSVTNWTANDRQVRISLQLGVSYDSDPKSGAGYSDGGGAEPFRCACRTRPGSHFYRVRRQLSEFRPSDLDDSASADSGAIEE